VNKIKKHLKDHKELYIGLGGGVAIAGFSYFIMRQYSNCSIRRDSIVPAKGGPAVPEKTSVNALEVNRGGLVLGDSYALNNVSFISADRKGPPSWVIRCLETGEIYPSQNKAANLLGLSASLLSEHLNGSHEHVDGLHFERICMAA
jgi:hypothetical protein